MSSRNSACYQTECCPTILLISPNSVAAVTKVPGHHGESFRASPPREPFAKRRVFRAALQPPHTREPGSRLFRNADRGCLSDIRNTRALNSLRHIHSAARAVLGEVNQAPCCESVARSEVEHLFEKIRPASSASKAAVDLLRSSPEAGVPEDWADDLERIRTAAASLLRLFSHSPEPAEDVPRVRLQDTSGRASSPWVTVDASGICCPAASHPTLSSPACWRTRGARAASVAPSSSTVWCTKV